MEEVLIGSYIRQKRLDKGWTQERLCEGVCNAATLSRIENNERTPSVSVAKALLQKLGLPDGQFFALLGKDDIAVEKLQKDIQSDGIRLRRAAEPERAGMRKQILAKLKKLEELSGEDNRFVQQFILSTEASIGGPDGSYSYEERLEKLLEAIRLTVPRFDVKNLPDFQYSVMEVIIINQIARTSGFLAIQAECHFFLRNLEKSKHFYYQAYYLYEVLGDDANRALMMQEMKERLGLEPPR